MSLLTNWAASARGAARQRVVAGVVAGVVVAAVGGVTAMTTRGHGRAGAPMAAADNATWRGHVDHAIPAPTPPATTIAWHDGYHHYIVAVGTAAAKPPTASGPDGRPGRWLRLSGPGQVANLSGANGLALLPWVLSVVTDHAGATWAQLADNAPAALGTGSVAPSPTAPNTEVDALRALPHTTVTYIDGHSWAVRTTASVATVERAAASTNVTADQLIPMQGTIANVSNDPLSDEQWYLQNRGDMYLQHPGDMTAGADADVPAAWALTRGRGVTVAVIDSGMDISNPDLAGALWTNPDEPCGSSTDLDHDGYVDDCHGWDFSDENPTGQLHPTDSPHGTAVAGVIAATGGNGIGISGIAPEAKIMPLDVSIGGSYLSESGIEAAMDYAINHHADIINASFGGLGKIPAGLQTELDKARAAGILVVVAAGNWGMNLDTSAVYPAGASVTNNNVVTVGWSNPNDTPSSISDYSPTKVQVFAPGTALMTTVPMNNNGFALFSGTSAAAPVVAGEAALLKSLDPGLTPAQIISTIESTSAPLAAFGGHEVSAGRVDVAAAVRSVADADTSIHYGFDGFNALTGAPQDTDVQVSADPSAIPPGDQVSLSLTLATRISGQTMVVTHYPVDVTMPDGSSTTVTTDGSGTATITGVDPSALAGSGGTFALATELPDGLYALAAQLDDVTAGAPIGSVGRVVFDVDGSPVPAPSTTLAPAPTTTAVSPTSAFTTTTAPGATTTTSPGATTTTVAGVTTTTAPGSTTTTPGTTVPSATTTTAPTTVPTTSTTAAPSPSSTSVPSVTTSTVPPASTTTVPLPPPPGMPTGFTATPGDASVTLAWSAPSGTVDGYRVYDDAGLVAQTSSLGITLTGLQNGLNYNFAVSAYTIYGESARTTPILVSPIAPTTTTGAATTTVPSGPTTSTVAPSPTTAPPASPYHVSPSIGSVDGGTAISITGPTMPDGIGIFIDNAAATDVLHVSAGLYTATTGPDVIAGTYDVQLVEDTGAIITIPRAFTYQSDSVTTTVPSVTSTTSPPVPSPPTTAPSASTTTSSTAPPAPSPTTGSPPPATTTPTTAPDNGLELSAAPPGGVLSDFPPGLWDGAVCRSATC